MDSASLFGTKRKRDETDGKPRRITRDDVQTPPAYGDHVLARILRRRAWTELQNNVHVRAEDTRIILPTFKVMDAGHDKPDDPRPSKDAIDPFLRTNIYTSIRFGGAMAANGGTLLEIMANIWKRFPARFNFGLRNTDWKIGGHPLLMIWPTRTSCLYVFSIGQTRSSKLSEIRCIFTYKTTWGKTIVDDVSSIATHPCGRLTNPNILWELSSWEQKSFITYYGMRLVKEVEDHHHHMAADGYMYGGTPIDSTATPPKRPRTLPKLPVPARIFYRDDPHAGTQMLASLLTSTRSFDHVAYADISNTIDKIKEIEKAIIGREVSSPTSFVLQLATMVFWELPLHVQNYVRADTTWEGDDEDTTVSQRLIMLADALNLKVLLKPVRWTRNMDEMWSAVCSHAGLYDAEINTSLHEGVRVRTLVDTLFARLGISPSDLALERVRQDPGGATIPFYDLATWLRATTYNLTTTEPPIVSRASSWWARILLKASPTPRPASPIPRADTLAIAQLLFNLYEHHGNIHTLIYKLDRMVDEAFFDEESCVPTSDLIVYKPGATTAIRVIYTEDGREQRLEPHVTCEQDVCGLASALVLIASSPPRDPNNKIVRIEVEGLFPFTASLNDTEDAFHRLWSLVTTHANAEEAATYEHLPDEMGSIVRDAWESMLRVFTEKADRVTKWQETALPVRPRPWDDWWWDEALLNIDTRTASARLKEAIDGLIVSQSPTAHIVTNLLEGVPRWETAKDNASAQTIITATVNDLVETMFPEEIINHARGLLQRVVSIIGDFAKESDARLEQPVRTTATSLVMRTFGDYPSDIQGWLRKRVKSTVMATKTPNAASLENALRPVLKNAIETTACEILWFIESRILFKPSRELQEAVTNAVDNTGRTLETSASHIIKRASDAQDKTLHAIIHTVRLIAKTIPSRADDLVTLRDRLAYSSSTTRPSTTTLVAADFQHSDLTITVDALAGHLISSRTDGKASTSFGRMLLGVSRAMIPPRLWDGKIRASTAVEEDLRLIAMASGVRLEVVGSTGMMSFCTHGVVQRAENRILKLKWVGGRTLVCDN